MATSRWIPLLVALLASACSGWAMDSADHQSSADDCALGISERHISEWDVFAVEITGHTDRLRQLAESEPSHLLVLLFIAALDGKASPSGDGMGQVWIPKSYSSEHARQVLSLIESKSTESENASDVSSFQAVWTLVRSQALEYSETETACYRRLDDGVGHELLLAAGRSTCKWLLDPSRDASVSAVHGEATRLSLRELENQSIALRLQGMPWVWEGPGSARLFTIAADQRE